jgi:hypothetical protein
VKNRSFFASSEAETCSARISTTNHSVAIILVVLECTCRYAFHNVIYVLKTLGIIIACERPSSGTVQALETFSRSKYIQIKLDISMGCHFTVCRVKKIAEIGLVLPENEGTRCGLHRGTATPFFVLSFHHLQASRLSFSLFLCDTFSIPL